MKRPLWRWIAAAVLTGTLWPQLSNASQRTVSDNVCFAAIGRAARLHGVPEDLLVGIALTETGQKVAEGVREPRPWAVNVTGRSYHFDTRREAVAFVEKNLRRGVRSIDVGCMQVNLLWHGKNFASVNEAFDPTANVNYAAGLLRTEFSATGNWQSAIGRYHSYDPGHAAEYRRMVAGNRRELPVTVAKLEVPGEAFYRDLDTDPDRPHLAPLRLAELPKPTPARSLKAAPELPKANLSLRRDVSLYSGNDAPRENALLAPAAGPLFARNERRPLYGPLSRAGG